MDNYLYLPDPSNEKGKHLVLSMIKKLRKGIFPDATSLGKITEYDVAFEMNNQRRNITFLEMAGEDLKQFSFGVKGDWIDPIKAILTCPGISLSFILVADYQNRVHDRDEDFLFHEFLTKLIYMRVNIARVGLVIAKFDRSSQERRVQDVMERYFPATLQILNSGHFIYQPQIFPFSIGEVAQPNPNEPAIIKNLELDDCKKIGVWLHQMWEPERPQSKGYFRKFLGL